MDMWLPVTMQQEVMLQPSLLDARRPFLDAHDGAP